MLRTKHRTKEVEGWVQDELHSQLLIPLLTVCLSWQLVSICVNVPAVAETSGRPPIELYIKVSWGKTSINNYFYEEFVLPSQSWAWEDSPGREIPGFKLGGRFLSQERWSACKSLAVDLFSGNREMQFTPSVGDQPFRTVSGSTCSALIWNFFLLDRLSLCFSW